METGMVSLFCLYDYIKLSCYMHDIILLNGGIEMCSQGMDSVICHWRVMLGGVGTSGFK